MMRYLLLIPFLLIITGLHAQRGPNDTIRVACIVLGKDTLPHVWLRDAIIVSEMTEAGKRARQAQRERRKAYDQLRRNVYTVYPYAVAAGFTLHDIDSALSNLYSKEAKKIYKRRKEDELNHQFKGELENLTITQGQILVKLIARQTGKPCYQIIKELKGGFNARIWQTVALIFDNNLKNNYDPTGDDEAIEFIVKEIEAGGRFERRY